MKDSQRRRRSTAALLASVALFIGGMCFTCTVAADEALVPVSLQMELLLKVAAYDKNLLARAGERVRLTVLIKKDEADSGRAAAQALKALSQADDVVGLPIEARSWIYTDGPALARLTSETSLSIVYITPGFEQAELESIARALSGLSVLSVGALAKYTSQGAVLGFDLAGGKPKLLVHLGQAKKQRVELSSSVLKLMRVIE